MTPEIQFETRNAVLIVTFNRPEYGNALNSSMARTLSDKLKAVSEDRGLRAVLLRGTGNQFMNGHDMSLLAGDANSVQEHLFQKTQFFYAAIRELHSMERPVISAVDGRVSGAGFSFLLASDIVIAAKRTVFNTDFIPHAIIPDGGVSFLLPRKIGASRATELLLLSEDVSCEHAEKIGLVNKVVADDLLQNEALALAEKMASGPTRIMGATKRLMNNAFERDMNAHLSIEATSWTAGSKTFDFREAMKAYTSKRDPKYSGS